MTRLALLADGRQLGGCVVASLTSDGVGDARRLSYCFRCATATRP